MSRPTDEQIRRLGASLREIDPATLHRDPEEGPVRWFQGERGTEITVWLDGRGAAHHIQLVFARASVEWSGSGLVTGAFENRGSTAGGRYDPYLLSVGTGADPEVCQAALLLLESAEVGTEVLAPLIGALRGQATFLTGSGGFRPSEKK